MRLSCFLAALASVCAACGSNRPPPLNDSEAGAPVFDYDASNRGDLGAPPLAPDAGGGAGASARDYEGVCTPGMTPIWHFHDFKTHTPGNAHIILTASTAPTQAALAKAPTVQLAVIKGPDIKTWAGVDVEPMLQSIGQRSLLWLRITTEMVPDTSDAVSPQMNASRQLYDCVVGQ